MPTFKLSISKPNKTVRSKITNKYEVIECKCDGIIVIDDNGVYKVNYKEKLYVITTESYNSRNKRTIYARWLDKYGHRIKIIRDVDNRRETNIKFYCAIAPGLIVRGKIVKSKFGPEMFHVVTCYNCMDMDGMSRAIKQWRVYEDKVKNGELNLNNEL